MSTHKPGDGIPPAVADTRHGPAGEAPAAALPPAAAGVPLFELVAVPLLNRRGLELVAAQNRWAVRRR